jgi:hypothetical protein
LSNREKKKREELQKTWLPKAEVQLGLAHRTVRWSTGQCPVEPGWSPVKRPLSGKVWRRTTIIHRTVLWCTGLSGEPKVASATVDRAIRGRRVAHANRRQGAPDCPVRQLARSYNGQLCQKRKEIRTGPSIVTVWWHTGLSGVPHDRRQDWPSLLASNGS